jgi:putative hydrolase of the HAD superfamily
MKHLPAIGFDLGDTLCEYVGVPLNWEQHYAAALTAVAEGCHLELSERRLRLGEQLLSRYNTRRVPRPDEREYTAEHIFQELLAEWDAPPEMLQRCIALFFGHFRRALRVFPDALSAIGSLKEAGISTAILTDVPYGMPRHLVMSDLVSTGLIFPDELVITSTDVGHRKPHPAGFAALARQLGVPSDRLIYVGNERKDVIGGNTAGCQTVLLWRSDDAPPSWGQTFAIRSLDELLTLPNISEA